MSVVLRLNRRICVRLYRHVRLAVGEKQHKSTGHRLSSFVYVYTVRIAILSSCSQSVVTAVHNVLLGTGARCVRR